jgi:hypothetical protein
MMCATVLVRLPPAYFDPAQETRVFPVIETLHGSPGHVEQWLGKLRLGGVLDQAVAAHRMAPAIVVSPDMNTPDSTDRECVDGGPGQLASETWASQDVPYWVEHTLRPGCCPRPWSGSPVPHPGSRRPDRVSVAARTGPPPDTGRSSVRPGSFDHQAPSTTREQLAEEGAAQEVASRSSPGSAPSVWPVASRAGTIIRDTSDAGGRSVRSGW